MSKLAYYLNEGLVTKVSKKEIVLSTFLNNHDSSLKLATKTFLDKDSDLWVVVISYYSMFYLANAYIYSKGYKIGSYSVHKITLDILEEFISTNLQKDIITLYSLSAQEALDLASSLTDSFKKEKEVFFNMKRLMKLKEQRQKLL
jgi:uncharacterized protein (UPF0332 family)